MEDQRDSTTAPLSGYHRYRSWVETKHPSVRIANKVLVTIAGVVVIAVGLVLIPLPGPGWLIVFFGLSILGLEFPPIQRFTSWIVAKLKSVWAAVKHWSSERRLSRARPHS